MPPTVDILSPQQVAGRVVDGQFRIQVAAQAIGIGIDRQQDQIAGQSREGKPVAVAGPERAGNQTLDLVGGDYDEVVCPVVDPELVAVGQFYSDFSEVSDSEVKRILQDI